MTGVPERMDHRAVLCLMLADPGELVTEGCLRINTSKSTRHHPAAVQAGLMLPVATSSECATSGRVNGAKGLADDGISRMRGCINIEKSGAHSEAGCAVSD